MKYIIYTDGGARGNPGPAGIGAVVLDEKGNILLELAEGLGETTNNVAEYTALVRVLEELKNLPKPSSIEVKMDSQLVVRQIEGVYKVREPHLVPLFQRAKELLSHYPHRTIDHIPREQNKLADALSNKGMDGKGVKKINPIGQMGLF